MPYPAFQNIVRIYKELWSGSLPSRVHVLVNFCLHWMFTLKWSYKCISYYVVCWSNPTKGYFYRDTPVCSNSMCTLLLLFQNIFDLQDHKKKWLLSTTSLQVIPLGASSIFLPSTQNHSVRLLNTHNSWLNKLESEQAALLQYYPQAVGALEVGPHFCRWE